MIFVESKRKKEQTLTKLYPNACVVDVTSKSKEPFIKLSPFYPHGDIPVPFSKNLFASSVEGIWQGLKVFENSDIDTSKFYVKNMKDIKRTVRKYGKTIGHRKGTENNELLDYLSARKKIYLPSYAWILQNKVSMIIDELISIALQQDLVLLDYETNTDIENIKKPLSHAGLIKKFIDKKYPELVSKRFCEPMSTKPRKGKKNNEEDNSEKITDNNQLKLNL
jgi:hypothetical protein